MKLFEFFITSIMLVIVLSILAVVAGFIFSKERTFKGRYKNAVELGIFAVSFLPFIIVPITILYNRFFR